MSSITGTLCSIAHESNRAQQHRDYDNHQEGLERQGRQQAMPQQDGYARAEYVIITN